MKALFSILWKAFEANIIELKPMEMKNKNKIENLIFNGESSEFYTSVDFNI